MFKLFTRRPKRIEIQGNNILIDNSKDNISIAADLSPVFKFIQKIPEIKVYENNQLIRLYRIDTLNTNSNLEGQYLHSSIRILENSAVMIDGVISKTDASFPIMRQ
jgi:hypothetical protein